MSENRDRVERIEVKGDKQSVLAALDHFFETQTWGRMEFEKDGQSISLWISSEAESTSC